MNCPHKWKDFLTKTSAGKRLALVFLGIKPCAEFNDAEYKKDLEKYGNVRNIRDLLKKNSRGDFGITDGKIVHREGFVIAFSDSSVKKVFEEHSKYFRGYTPESTVGLYLEQLGSPPETTDEKEKDIQRGLLFGFPIKEVEKYSKYLDIYNKFIGVINRYIRIINDSSTYTSDDQIIVEDGQQLQAYFKSSDPKYRAEHQESIANIIEKYAKEYRTLVC